MPPTDAPGAPPPRLEQNEDREDQMTEETIRIETDPRGVARLTLARPEKHNAMSGQMLEDLTEAANRLGRDPAVRVIVLAGDGASFCAGGDLAWMRAQIGADGPTRAREAMKLAHMLQAINTCPKPVIGRVHGNAFGGGVGVISVCDVAIAAETARFGLTETRLGLIPATIGPYVAARMGEAKARRVFMSARLFDAEEAVRLDLLARAVPLETLDAAVEAEVVPYLSAAPGAVGEAKALLRRLGPPINEAVIAETVDALVRRWESPESAEGIAAFFEKRPAAGGWARGEQRDSRKAGRDALLRGDCICGHRTALGPCPACRDARTACAFSAAAAPRRAG